MLGIKRFLLKLNNQRSSSGELIFPVDKLVKTKAMLAVGALVIFFNVIFSTGFSLYRFLVLTSMSAARLS